MKDERFYEIASAEVEAGKIRPGLRAKAFSDARGEENRAQALYLKYRAAQLAQEESQTRQALTKAQKQRKKHDIGVRETSREILAEDENFTLAHVVSLVLFASIVGIAIWKLL